MTTERVAVVTTQYGNWWNESEFALRRIAAAIATEAEVDVLHVGGPTASSRVDGALEVHRVPAAPFDQSRRWAFGAALFGPHGAHPDGACRCESELWPALASNVPRSVQEAVVVASAGASPLLLERLHTGGYDAVLFHGWSTAAFATSLAVLRDDVPVTLIAGSTFDPAFHLPIIREAMERVDVALALNDREAKAVGALVKSVAQVSVPLRVNELARRDPPPGFNPTNPTVVVAKDWNSELSGDELTDFSQRLVRDVTPHLRLRLVGPGAESLHWWVGVGGSASRTDCWRWMASADIVLDPSPHVTVGREVLEGMLFGTPVIVRADGDATREHAERSDGGLWYDTYDQLAACIDRLLGDTDLANELGENAARYARARTEDTGRFTKDVIEAVLG